uniref:Uncharacterized protein n=1 Tax=Arundo donax TaxID=35708 RepID=A0A0A9DTX6_ARUDO
MCNKGKNLSTFSKLDSLANLRQQPSTLGSSGCILICFRTIKCLMADGHHSNWREGQRVSISGSRVKNPFCPGWLRI